MIRQYRLLLLAFSFIILGCDDQLNINDDPARVGSEKVTLSSILPAVEQFTSAANYNAILYSSRYSHHTTSYNDTGSLIERYGGFGFDAAWNSAYLDALSNLNQMEILASERDASHYEGIAKTLFALNLMFATDIWGDLPYSEAFNPEFLQPKYDSQESIYSALGEILDDAISLLENANTNDAFTPGADDLIYGGDIDKWIKAAYSIRARYYIHLTNKDQETNAQLALDQLDKAMSSNDDDLQLFYTDDPQRNPWFSQTTGGAPPRPAQYFINNLNGSNDGPYPGLTDPRLPYVAELDAGETEYMGRKAGSPDTYIPAPTVTVGASTFYAQAKSPVLIVTYAEMKFIEAEAAFMLNDKATAYDAYLEGITAHMAKVGVSEEDITTYLTSPMIGVGMNNLTISDIMVQKHIATYLQLEGWTDMRRYNFDTSVYIGLEEPLNKDQPDIDWAYRGKYPDNEPGRNANVPSVPLPAQGYKTWLFQ